MDDIGKLTTGQKAAVTRRKNKDARQESEMNRKKTIHALEQVIQDNESSREAREAAIFLLVRVYGNRFYF